MMKVTGSTQLVGLIGWPVAHSLSPAMQNAAAADLQIDMAYVPLPVRSEALESAISGLVTLGFTGANVTVPHKEAVLPFLHHVDDAAAIIGAVNTIVIHRNPESSDPEVVVGGYNTDWSGFLLDLEAYGWEPGGKSCLVLGAGGSARAVAYGLVKAEAQVAVASRRVEQARELVRNLEPALDSGQLGAYDLMEVDDLCRQIEPDLIVNATPVGMAPNVNGTPWPESATLPQNSLVYDLVYQPRETRFLIDAQKAGCRVANGLGMLIQQGALSFELWTGEKPDIKKMALALE
jgi:shikimate dehydrogenase